VAIPNRSSVQSRVASKKNSREEAQEDAKNEMCDGPPKRCAVPAGQGSGGWRVTGS